MLYKEFFIYNLLESSRDKIPRVNDSNDSNENFYTINKSFPNELLYYNFNDLGLKVKIDY